MSYFHAFKINDCYTSLLMDFESPNPIILHLMFTNFPGEDLWPPPLFWGYIHRHSNSTSMGVSHTLQTIRSPLVVTHLLPHLITVIIRL